MQLYGKSRRQEWLARYLLQVVFIIGEVSDGGMNGIDIEAIARDTIHMVDSPDMAAEHFRGKIRQRLTEAPLMRPGMWLKILLLPESLISAKFRLPMRLALHSLFLSP